MPWALNGILKATMPKIYCWITEYEGCLLADVKKSGGGILLCRMDNVFPENQKEFLNTKNNSRKVVSSLDSALSSFFPKKFHSPALGGYIVIVSGVVAENLYEDF